jgi:hypothetical protein
MTARRQILSMLAAIGAVSCMSVPAFADNLQLTLNNVTFNDGATATGFFDYDTASNTIEAYKITTTNGTSDGLIGSTYQSPLSNANPVTNFLFQFTNSNPNSNLTLVCFSNPITGPGTFQLDPGTVNSPSSYNNSGEMAPVWNNTSQSNARAITGGSLVASVLPVPEASTFVLFGLMLVGGAGVMRARRAKTTLA